MLRLIAAASVALLFAGAGVARADDCTRTLAAGSGRPLWLTGSFTEADADVNLSWLSANGHLANVHYAQSASPTLVTRPDGRAEVVMWLRGAIVAEYRGARRVLVPQVAFPGSRGVAAAESADGTITLLVIVRHLTAAGVFGPATVLPSRDAYAVALDPRTGDPWVLAHADSALVLQRPGRTVPIRAPRPFEASRGAVAIDASGRAWVVLEGSDDRWNRACHDPVRWATFGLHARHVTSLRLNTEQRRDTT